MEKTHIVILLDRSGSMDIIKGATVKSINNFIEEQKAFAGKTTFSLYQFDDPVSANRKGEEFPKITFDTLESPFLSEQDYKPRNNTALVDAACIVIDKLGETLSTMAPQERPNKVAFVILTDGLENASNKYTRKDLKSRIEHQQSKYNWKFYYLGANQNAVIEGAKYGFNSQDTETYEATNSGVMKGVRGASQSVGLYRNQ